MRATLKGDDLIIEPENALESMALNEWEDGFNKEENWQTKHLLIQLSFPVEDESKKERDIQDFAANGDFLKSMKQAREIYDSPTSTMMRGLAERSALYLEFLTAAFIKETGLKASECELVCEQLNSLEGGIVFKWRFQKRRESLYGRS